MSQTVPVLLRRAISEEVAPQLAFGLSASEGPQQLFYTNQASSSEVDAPAREYFDLASLTKALTTVTWTYQLVARGALTFEAELGILLPELRGRLAKATISDLLTHRSGLPAHRPFFSGLMAPRVTGQSPGVLKACVREMIARTPVDENLCGETCYSDLGFLLLEWACERASGEPLERCWMGLPLHGQSEQLHFRPLPPEEVTPRPQERKTTASTSFSSERIGEQLYVPTERCGWRQRLLCGEVHDDNCWLIGGVGGHAGLFGTLEQVLSFGRAILDACHRAQGPLAELHSLLQETLLREARSPGNFLFGWDTPSPPPKYSSAGRRFGAYTIGHLGFTGTSIWIDLEQEVVMTLLSNRVCPDRTRGAGIRWLRPRLHDAAWASLQS